jgi:hypothetical protein
MTPPLDAVFSRPRTNTDGPVELRGDCPRLTVDVLDAVANARRVCRTELVNQILGDWAKQQLTEASLVARVTRGNPLVAEWFEQGA